MSKVKKGEGHWKRFCCREGAGLDDFEHFHLFRGYDDEIVYACVRKAAKVIGETLTSRLQWSPNEWCRIVIGGASELRLSCSPQSSSCVSDVETF